MIEISSSSFSHSFGLATIVIGHRGPASVVFLHPSTRHSVRRAADELALEASFGEVRLAGEKLPVRFKDWHRTWGAEPGIALVASLADRRTAEILEEPVGESDVVAVHQSAINEEDATGLLSRVAGEIEVRPPPDGINVAPGACFFCSGATTRAEFLDEVTARLRHETADLIGWRVLVGESDSTICFSVADPDEPIELDVEHWAPAREQNFAAPGDPILLRHRLGKTHYEYLDRILPDLLNTRDPPDGLFGGGGSIPASPGWVRYGLRSWFAHQVRVDVSSSGDHSEIKSVTLALVPRPSYRCPDTPSLRTVEALVSGWADDGTHLLVEPHESARWKIAGEPASHDGALAVRTLTPARFAEEGGLYLRPHRGIPRHVVLAQGEVPWSGGTILERDDEAEEDGVDIRWRASKFSIESEVAVKGTMDVSE